MHRPCLEGRQRDDHDAAPGRDRVESVARDDDDGTAAALLVSRPQGEVGPPHLAARHRVASSASLAAAYSRSSSRSARDPAIASAYARIASCRARRSASAVQASMALRATVVTGARTRWAYATSRACSCSSSGTCRFFFVRRAIAASLERMALDVTWIVSRDRGTHRESRIELAGRAPCACGTGRRTAVPVHGRWSPSR